MKFNSKYFYLSAVIIWGMQSCTAPKSIIESGKVTPKGAVRASLGTTTNIPTAFTQEVVGFAIDNAGIVKGDSFQFQENLENVVGSLVSYSLDPLTQTVDFHLRYGIGWGLDIGYKNLSGVSVIDLQYQFAGEDRPLSFGGLFASSIGIQYSGQKLRLNRISQKLDEALGMEFRKRDFMLKWINSYPFGEDEKYGHIGFGAAWNRTISNYGISPTKVLTRAEELGGQKVTSVLEPMQDQRTAYSSWGGFLNLRLGYKYVYLYGAISMFHQNYGTYQIFKDVKYQGKGWTFIPTFGLQVQLPIGGE